MTLNEYIENFYEPRVILSHSETDFPVTYNFRDITLDLLKDYDKIVFSTKRMRTLWMTLCGKRRLFVKRLRVHK